MMNIYDQSIVMITGGASGIGESVVKQLSLLGAKIIIVDRDSKAGNKLVEYLKPKNEYVEYKNVDMTSVSEVEKLFDDIVKKYSKVDFVFNSAGIFMAGEIRDTPIENWQKVIENNIWAVYNGSHFAYQTMLKQGNGHIINFSSSAGLFPVPVMGIYGSSKFAIVGMSHALRNEAKSLGIKVSVICPTIVNTPLYDTAIYNNFNKAKALKARSKFQTPDVAAKKLLKGVSKNKATIHTAVSTKMAWIVYKIIPSLYNYFAQRAVIKYRHTLRINKSH